MKRKAKNWMYMGTLSFALLTILSCNSPEKETGIRAGVAKANITPPYGTIINGDFLPAYAQHIHDSLYAKALAFDNGKEQFVFVVVDNMTIDDKLILQAKEIIFESTGLKPEQVMVSSTHAHSCGSVIDVATCQADMNYRLMMPDKIVEATLKALENLQPAKIAWGMINVPDHVICRRWFMKPGFPMINPFGEEEKVWMNPPPGSKYLDRPVSPTDPEVGFLAVKSTDDEWISLLANYSTHYVGDVPRNTISADYFGELDVRLKMKLGAGDSFIGILSNGTSGDVNTIDFEQTRNYPQGNFEKTALIANEIADSILVALDQSEWTERPVFKVASGYTEVDRRQARPEILEWCETTVRTTDYNSLVSTGKASDDLSKSYAMDILRIESYFPEQFRLLSQAVRIGEGTIGTLPGEFFSETGLKLKENAPTDHYFTITLANAQVGYVPPLDQFDLGGYETWLCSGSMAGTDSEERIYNSLNNLIQTVYKP